MSHRDLRVDVHLDADDIIAALRDDVAKGLGSVPKQLPPKWFYDDVGSQLFDRITRLPEYYPTERERQILRDRAALIAEASGCDTLVELGAGTADKTRVLLDAMASRGHLTRYIPFDISESTLRDTARRVGAEYHIDVHGVCGDFEHHLRHLPHEGQRMIAFLGGTIGNQRPAERNEFLSEVAALMDPGDCFLLGTDLVKDVGRLEAAYDDAQGVTAEFNLNVLRVINRELGADFSLDAFEHLARFDTDEEWIEMHLRSKVDQRVTVADLGLEVAFGAGELMLTEISAKFRKEGVDSELADAGLEMTHWLTDPRGDFALSLSRLRS